MARTLNTLVDPFNTTAINGSLWTATTAGSMTISYTTTGVVMTFPSSSTATDNAQLVSNTTYDLTGSYFLAKITTTPTTLSAADGVLWLWTGSSTTNSLRFVVEGGTLFAQYWVASVKNTPGSIAYNSTTMLYWRIREYQGKVWWDYSGDGYSWTNLANVATPITITALTAQVSANGTTTSSNPGTFTALGLNVVDNPKYAVTRIPNKKVGPMALRNKFRPIVYLQGAAGANAYSQALSGSLSFVGSQAKASSKVLSGSLNFSATLAKLTSHLLSGSLSFVGAIAKSTRHPMSGAVSFVGNQSKAVNKALSGSLSFSGAIARSVVHLFSASVNFSGALTKQTAHLLSGAVSFSGLLNTSKTYIRALTASLSFSGNQTKATSKLHSGSLSFSGAITKRTSHLLSASVSFVGNITRLTARTAFSASVSFAGNLSRRTNKSLSASVSFAGNIAKSVARAFGASISFVGGITRRTAKSMASSLSFTGAIGKGMRLAATSFTAGLSFTGNLATSYIPFVGGAVKLLRTLMGVGK